ncbi:hypothetical protein P3T35_006396 [Kitasatospora sp. GP30]|nr:hypothetical protein [Kitasatospora sp. GP30]MDH6144354.1 hypothetical protein [Kitasatospora sp. GP30]
MSRLLVTELTDILGRQHGDSDVRAAVHELHAACAILVEPSDQE